MLNPPGGSPAGISSLPGLSGLSDLAGTALSAFGGGIPGQVARFTSTPLTALTVVSGTPRVSVSISAVGLAQAVGTTTAGDGAVLFASMSKVSSGGNRVLAGSAVAPIRVTGLPTDGTARTVRIDLPAVAFQVEAGSRLEVDLSTTDQAYAAPTSPAVYEISLASPTLDLPEVGGVRVSAGDVPIATLVALIALVVLVVIALILLGRVRKPHAGTAMEGQDVAPDGRRLDWDSSGPPPLEIIGLGQVVSGWRRGGDRCELPRRDRSGAGPSRAQWRRQDDHAAHGHGPHHADGRRDQGLRPTGPSGRRDTVPQSAVSSKGLDSCRTCPAP